MLFAFLPVDFISSLIKLYSVYKATVIKVFAKCPNDQNTMLYKTEHTILTVWNVPIISIDNLCVCAKELQQDHLFSCLWFRWQARGEIQPAVQSKRVNHQQRRHSIRGAGGPADPWCSAEECTTSHWDHHQFTGGHGTVETWHCVWYSFIYT